MEKEFKHPEPLEMQGSSDDSTSSSKTNTPVVTGRPASDDERTRFAKRKRIRAYQKIDYWQ